MDDHDDNDWDPDITGDPMLDQFGYESPPEPELMMITREHYEPDRDP